MSALFSNDEDINSTVNEYLNRQLELHGNLKYAYMIMNKKNPSEVVIISNYPRQWVDTYLENNYQHIDPVILTAINKISPFSWDDNQVVNSRLKFSRIFNLSKQYNIVNGYTFVLHDNNHNLAMLSLMFDEHDSSSIEEVIKSNKNKLQMLLIEVHEKIIMLYKDLIESEKNKAVTKKEIFSQRENEILYWASIGKTYPEIAVILGIKISTVKFHIGNVVKKLGVLNAKHAIRLGVELQLIQPAPL
ncbi:LuxR family transcriptional regulator [Erwiniaceae bacterium BAC15a-03b]|uniref:LuxR family transcriptional regulator n=1 Tax=Winslowiella arboricola TaxID=2978220 RepID=A0A9J6PZZ3_9GAMM|nr:LuxR family transcriptional regulator [Winslowiella arboricola]MCU5775583.1 LuxR family transcriptional regulator [Winslowiella arboricola]MCU5779567.1 LuxR family transcriptional regulator [Winslowiella arboricola]